MPPRFRLADNFGCDLATPTSLVHSCWPGHRSNIRSASELEPIDPHAARITFTLSSICRRASTVNEKGVQVAISALAYSEQHSSLAATMLTRHQSEPSAQLAPSFELPSVTYRRNQRCRDQWT